jgi:hypothetical protein
MTDEPNTEETELVAFADSELIPINEAMTLVINRRNGNQQMVSAQVVEGLKTCTNFDTLKAHAAHLANTRAELKGNEAMAAAGLRNLRAAGMLLLADDICAGLAQAAPRQPAPSRVFIITCDRPAAVERLLDSMLRAGKLSHHDALFLVDDSREPGNRAANQEAVLKFNLRSAKEMFYFGADAQAELLSGLVAALPAHADGIRFLLEPALWQGRKTYGRSRTLCLLLCVGYRALIMDDDILCQAMQSPITETGIGIGSGGLRKAAFFASRRELLDSGQPAGFDPLSGHAALLGRSLGQALQTLNKGPLLASQLRNTNAALANVLSADSPILVTQCGSLGDPGTLNSHWAMYQGDDTIQRLLAAPHGITQALQNRQVWLGSSRPNFYKMPFMSQLTGLDNSHLLPPYFPAFRGEDLLFGAMLVAIQSSSLALEFPWCVPHLPLEERTLDLQLSAVARGGVSLLARYLTAQIDYRDTTAPEQKLQRLSLDTLRLAERTDADLLLDYRAELAKGQADQLHILQGQFARAQQLPSPEWQGYLKRGIEDVQQALMLAQSPTGITGVPPEASELELIAEFRRLARGFAAALAGWVAMREVSAELTAGLVSSRAILPR